MKSTYSLENTNEYKRLETQNEIACYRVEHELVHLDFKDGASILDAGCGSGLVSKALLNEYRNITIEAIDISETRIEQAKAAILISNQDRINFKANDLLNIAFNDNSFDYVINRYVLEHVSSPQAIVKELCRVAKRGGSIYIIDVDGILFNLNTSNELLSNYLKEIASKVEFDLFVGRKIPQLLKEAGAINIEYHVETMAFNPKELLLEKENYVQRFDQIKDLLITILGSKERAEEFVRIYLLEMTKEGTTLFYNKFIVKAVKP